MTTTDAQQKIAALSLQRQNLVKRNAEIDGAMAKLIKSDPQRAEMIGEKTTNQLHLKRINAELADAQRAVNGNEADRAKAQADRAIFGPPITELATGMTTRQFAAIAAMHALVEGGAVDMVPRHSRQAVDYENNANSVAEAAWKLAEAMFPRDVVGEYTEDDE